ncbi:fumarate hydratase C-terminal domain-containing protein [Methanobrevibacter sp. DSM 116169]|uniref:fumarate hydratase C-terminal domain-containing protein n=1 Tax=Methanobrevibacter sp. DSM 116169 TaxID=3242727 RepID=UPI0038FCC735
MINLTSPFTSEKLENLNLGDKLNISGEIYTARDKALPTLVESIKKGNPLVNVQNIAIMHTGVSDAGIGPTTSNKKEIESNIGFLSSKGVKIHIGKGSLSNETIEELNKNKSIFVITPPVTALLSNCILKKECVALPEYGMEAIYKLKVENIPGIVASIHGKSI